MVTVEVLSGHIKSCNLSQEKVSVVTEEHVICHMRIAIVTLL